MLKGTFTPILAFYVFRTHLVSL